MVIIIGVCGRSGSGKTTVCKKIKSELHIDGEITIMSQDNFYKSLTPEQLQNVSEYNFDSPEAIDMDSLYEKLLKIKNSETVDIPCYDFKSHQRTSETIAINKDRNLKILFLEGIMTFVDERIRNIFDIKICVSTDADKCLIRRIRRDIKDRGRDIISVLNQWETFVEPSYKQYIMPTERYADVIIPSNGNNDNGRSMILGWIMHQI